MSKKLLQVFGMVGRGLELGLNGGTKKRKNYAKVKENVVAAKLRNNRVRWEPHKYTYHMVSNQIFTHNHISR